MDANDLKETENLIPTEPDPETDGSIETDNEKKASGTKAVLKVAGRTAFWFLFGVTLFLAAFTAFFPYASMKMYHSLGMDKKALYHAERVINSKYSDDAKYNSKFADALYLALPLSAEFMEDAAKNKPLDGKAVQDTAKKVLKYTVMHEALGYGVETKSDMLRRDMLIDEAVKELPNIFHPDSYRYRDRVRADYMRAKFITTVLSGKDNGLSEFLNELSDFNMIWNDITYSDALAEANAVANMDGYMRMFFELNAVIGLELSVLGYDYVQNDFETREAYISRKGITASGNFLYLYDVDGNGKTNSLDVVEKSLATLKDYILSGFDVTGGSLNPSIDMLQANYLKRAYWARCVSLLIDNIDIMISILYVNRTPYTGADIQTLWDAWRGYVSSVISLYGDCLEDYLNSFKPV